MLKTELQSILSEEFDLRTYENTGLGVLTIGNSPMLPMVIVSNTKKNSLAINELATISDELFDVIIEFTSTEIEDREEEEEEDRYSVYFYDVDGDKWYLGYNTHTETYSNVHWSDYEEMDDYLTTEQVDNLPERYHPDSGFTDIENVN